MKQIIIITIIFSILFIIGCESTDNTTLSVVRKLIEKSNQDMELAFQNNDINLLLSLYSDDCIISLVGINDVTGKNDIEKLFKAVFKYQKVKSYKLNIEELEVFNNSALERGTSYWHSEFKNGKVWKVSSRYWTWWRKNTENNTWKIHRFIENKLPISDKNQ